jgi:hypothetical protein
MSVLASIISGSASIKDNHTGRPGIRDLKAMLQAIGDFDTPANCAGKNEVQSIAVYSGTVSGGNFKLTFSLANGQSFTTANIAHSANAAAILSAINTAASAVTGWTNGDIAVSGGDLTANPVVVTFSGNSVKNANHGLITVDSTGLTGGGSAGAVSVTTSGQVERTVWALFFAFGILGGTIPDQGSDLASVTARLKRGQFPFSIGEGTIRALCREAAIADANASVESSLLTLLGY